MKQFIPYLNRFPLELVFWIGSIIAILMLDPHSGSHLSLCPLSQLGIDWCPGCGLGRSMSLLAHGEFEASLSMHPLGILAYGVIFHRIWNLVKNLKTTHNYGKCIETPS
ncbi:DUF2752 domain-containing protein [Algoriphagus sp.]|uniref:DUF2752 domain-containing protein n=1 Tax=Algoriphagus sp. TaxID=1872435 RepID=UPI0027264400|nr:DUF2752 domain-containing protein [Algoriphagus sp.]MDO8967787.1 DUF2752 domain-containing protein [Algoriphagus sp.]MDP3201246.1 DUF2752 domain-containing protein [Algoriphagus sp.]